MAATKRVIVDLDRELIERICEEAKDADIASWLRESALLRLQAINVSRLASETGVSLNKELLGSIEMEWPKDDI